MADVFGLEKGTNSIFLFSDMKSDDVLNPSSRKVREQIIKTLFSKEELIFDDVDSFYEYIFMNLFYPCLGNWYSEIFYKEFRDQLLFKEGDYETNIVQLIIKVRNILTNNFKSLYLEKVEDSDYFKIVFLNDPIMEKDKLDKYLDNYKDCIVSYRYGNLGTDNDLFSYNRILKLYKDTLKVSDKKQKELFKIIKDFHINEAS